MRESRAAEALAPVVDAVHDIAAGPGVGDVDEVPNPGAAVVGLVRHAACVEPARDSRPEDLDRRLRVQWDLQSAPEVAASPERQHGEAAGRGDGRTVVEEAVDDLIERPVATDCHDPAS